MGNINFTNLRFITSFAISFIVYVVVSQLSVSSRSYQDRSRLPCRDSERDFEMIKH
jgi:hypothetical protein